MNSSPITQWLTSFVNACQKKDSNAINSLFAKDGQWRDYLAFDLNLQTVRGSDQIAEFCLQRFPSTGLTALRAEEDSAQEEGAFRFDTRLGSGRGYLRIENGVCTTLFTSLLDLNCPDSNTASPSEQGDPYVLIVGGGQSGLALGAYLSHLDIPYLIVDKYPRVGDQWRSRYDSLVLHDPVWFDHLPFIPYPDSWPVFTPKDQMGDWLESYAETLGLNVSISTTLTHAEFDEKSGHWTARINQSGQESNVSATHLVFALGLSGFPYVPPFQGKEDFAGKQFHSSEFKASAEMKDANVVVVGANNSAHDIAADLVAVGAKPVMLQRSSTLVVKQSVYCDKLLGKLYSKSAVEQGISVDEADFLFSSLPMELLEERHRELWKEIAKDDAPFYQQLNDAGFSLDFAEDGAGLGLKYRRTASGYYIDVGASDMVIDGRIAIRSGVNIEHLTENQVVLDTGESVPADLIVYATGYGNMIDWVEKLIDQNTAKKVGPLLGLRLKHQRRSRPLDRRTEKHVDTNSPKRPLVHGRQPSPSTIFLPNSSPATPSKIPRHRQRLTSKSLRNPFDRKKKKRPYAGVFQDDKKELECRLMRWSPPTYPIMSICHDRTPITREYEEETNMNDTTIGLDIAKNIFHLVELNSTGKPLRKKILRRAASLPFFAQGP